MESSIVFSLIDGFMSYHKYVQNETRYLVSKMGENRAGYAIKSKLKSHLLSSYETGHVFQKMLAVLNYCLLMIL